MFSVEDLAFMADELNHDETEKDADLILSDDGEDNSDSAFIADDMYGLKKQSEINFTNYSFRHGACFLQDKKFAMAAMASELEIGEEDGFRGILIDTCAKRSSIMSLRQYRAYCSEFKAPLRINPETKTISGIGGKSKTLGFAEVPYHLMVLTCLLM